MSREIFRCCNGTSAIWELETDISGGYGYCQKPGRPWWFDRGGPSRGWEVEGEQPHDSHRTACCSATRRTCRTSRGSCCSQNSTTTTLIYISSLQMNSMYMFIINDDAHGETSSSSLPNDKRIPVPSNILYVLGSNQAIVVGTMTSLAKPGSTGEAETVAMALIWCANSIQKQMQACEIGIGFDYCLLMPVHKRQVDFSNLGNHCSVAVQKIFTIWQWYQFQSQNFYS